MPSDTIPDLKPRILDRAGQAVIGARAAEGQKMAAGLEDAEDLFPEWDSGNAVIPVLAHERKPVRRVCDTGIDGRLS